MQCKNILVLAGVLLAGFMPSMLSGAAYADDDRQVWRDTDGQIVHNTWGMCVRSRWETDIDYCAPPAPPPAKVIWTPPKRTVIAKEDRTIYFGFNKTELTPEDRAKLDLLAATLKSANDVQGAEVAGYADRIGSVSYNEALSKKRAEGVRNYLVAHDIVNTNVTQTRWFGKSEPSASCPNNLPRAKLIECLQPDRKVQVDITYKTIIIQAPEPQPQPQPPAQ